MANVTVTDNSVTPKSITVDGAQTITVSDSAKPTVTVVTDTLTISQTGVTGVSSVNGETGDVTLNTDDISQGTTNLYYADSLVDAHLVGGTGVTYSAGNISIGQPVGTTDNVTFNTVTATDEFLGHLDGSIRFTGKNRSGGTIEPGQVIYISGLSGNTPEVDLAQSNSSSTMPAFGIAIEQIGDNNNGQFATFGSQRGLDVTDFGETGITFALGDTLYISATQAGRITNVAPSGESNFIQNIGKIERATPTTNMTIKVGGAGRTNATPALNDGNIFIGDSNNNSVTASLDTSVSALGYITASSTDTLTNKSGNISQWTNDAGYITSETDSQTLSFSSPNLTISNGNTVDISALTPTSLDFSAITNTPTTLAGYGITDGLAAVEDDTSPTLGGTLNVNDFAITNTAVGSQYVDIDTHLRITGGHNFRLTNTANTQAVTIAVDPTLAANYSFVLPKTNGSAGQFLRLDSSGVYLEYADVATELVEDLTPQLGGTLDANGNIIDMGVNEITDTKVGNWDTAYSWGDHSTAGYLTSFTETDPIVGAVNGIVKADGAGNISAAIAGTDYSTYADADVDTHLNTSTATSGEVLSWTGTDYDWITVSSGGLGNVVEDLTPQLGGDLDTNGNIIFDSTGDNVTVEEDKLIVKPSGGDRNITLGDETFGGSNFLLTNLKVDGQEERWAWITLDEHSDGGFPKSIAGGNFTNPLIISRIQGGTPGNEVGLLANKRIFGLQATVGYDDDGAGTNYVLPTSASFRFQAETTENQRSTARGAKVYFDTIANGSTSTTRTLEMQGSVAKFAGTIDTTGASDLTIKANGGSNDIIIDSPINSTGDLTIQANSGSNDVTITRPKVNVYTATSSGTITPNFADGEWQVYTTVTENDAITFNTPSNLSSGQEMRITVYNNTGSDVSSNVTVSLSGYLTSLGTLTINDTRRTAILVQNHDGQYYATPIIENL